LLASHWVGKWGSSGLPLWLTHNSIFPIVRSRVPSILVIRKWQLTLEETTAGWVVYSLTDEHTHELTQSLRSGVQIIRWHARHPS